MKFVIRHTSSRRIRVHMAVLSMTMHQADLLEYHLLAQPGVAKVTVNEQTADAAVIYDPQKTSRAAVLAALDAFSYASAEEAALVPEESGRALNRQYQGRLIRKIAFRFLRRLIPLPVPFRHAIVFLRSIRFILKGLLCLANGRLEVPVLDAIAIVASMLTGDFATAGSVMFLLDVGEILEEWTHKKSVGDLARAMSLNVDRVWVQTAEGDVLVSVRDVVPGDRILLHTSNIISLDGSVVSGEMTVNQSSMTGESVPVVKEKGSYVYAGTVVEEGECVVEVTRAAGTGKYDQIVRMIEDSEKLKSETESRAFHLADSLVPWSLGGTVLTYLLTRNITRALSFLMVDFSCALKLSMPLAVLSAIRQAGTSEIAVKGGKFLEAVAEADTIVFDKTGTLTHAQPTVMEVHAFDNMSERGALRLAACLEEHYPHSMANAIVRAAEERGLIHEEMHTDVQYVVAHGIASTVGKSRALIGSYHFVVEDEGCLVTPEQTAVLESLPEEYSRLYLAVDGRLKAVICIFDPLRKEAAGVIDELHRLGISKVCMMTGDSSHAASAVAKKLSIDEYHAGVLPEDKASFIIAEHQKGRKVLMVGDGVNDTPALSEADCGIAISDGAAIARQVADITISSDSLVPLVTLRRLSMALMDRIHSNYRFIIGFNGALIALGVLGILTPSTSALLHNGSTIFSGLVSMTDLPES